MNLNHSFGFYKNAKNIIWNLPILWVICVNDAKLTAVE